MKQGSDQPEFDFDHTLPAGKEWFSPRWLARHWGRSAQHVLNLIDTGAIKTGADMRGEKAKRSNINIPRWAVIDFLDRRKL
jgi:hypothetical protein